MKINIFGVEYNIIETAAAADRRLERCDGFCDTSTKELIIDTEIKKPHPTDPVKKNMKEYFRKVKRHEIIHAVLYESGLDINSDWARNEEMVDWFAIQFPKLQKLFKEADCQ